MTNPLPFFQDQSKDAARAFRMALKAMAMPGKIQNFQVIDGLPTPLSIAGATLILVFCDFNTKIFLGETFRNKNVEDWINFYTGAKISGDKNVDFAVGHIQELLPFHEFPIGTDEYPDRSANIVIENASKDVKSFSLNGPGIKETLHVELPEKIIERESAISFPLGVDIFLAKENFVMGLPRTTMVET